MLFVESQPSLFAWFKASNSGFSDDICARLGLCLIETLEFARLLDGQADQNPPPNCVDEISSRSRVVRSNHTEARTSI